MQVVLIQKLLLETRPLAAVSCCYVCTIAATRTGKKLHSPQMLQPQRRLDKVEDSQKLCPRSASRCSATPTSVRVKDKVSSTVTVRGPNTRSACINSYLNSSSHPTPEHMSPTASLSSLSNRNRTAGRTSPTQSCDCQAVLESQSISTTSAKPCMGCLSGLAPSLSIAGRTCLKEK